MSADAARGNDRKRDLRERRDEILKVLGEEEEADKSLRNQLHMLEKDEWWRTIILEGLKKENADNASLMESLERLVRNCEGEEKKEALEAVNQATQKALVAKESRRLMEEFMDMAIEEEEE